MTSRLPFVGGRQVTFIFSGGTSSRSGWITIKNADSISPGIVPVARTRDETNIHLNRPIAARLLGEISCEKSITS